MTSNLNERFFDCTEARKAYTRMAFSMVIYYIVSVLFFYAINGFFLCFFPSFLSSQYYILFANSVSMYLVGLPVMMLFAKSVPVYRRPEEQTITSNKNLIKLAAICFGLMYIGNYIGQFVNNLLYLFSGSEPENAVQEIVSESDFFLTLLVVGIIGPVAEEIIYRKVVLDRLSAFGEKNAMIWSAVVFGVIHGNFYQFFYAFFLGLIFSYIYIRTGKIRYSIMFHIIINTESVIYGELLGKLGFSEMLMGLMNAGSEEEIVSIISSYNIVAIVLLLLYRVMVFVFGVIGIIILIKRLKLIFFEKTRYEVPKEKRFSVGYVNIGFILLLLLYGKGFLDTLL